MLSLSAGGDLMGDENWGDGGEVGKRTSWLVLLYIRHIHRSSYALIGSEINVISTCDEYSRCATGWGMVE